MTRSILAALLTVACAAPAAADQYGGFQQFSDRGSLKPFARDLGGILGSGTFHSGRNLGFTGWELGFRGAMQFSPEKNDLILRRNGVRGFGLPWVQVDVGVPLRFDVFVRGVSYEGLAVSGGGLRWGIVKDPEKPHPWTFHLLAAGVAHSFVHQHFSGVHAGINLAGSMKNNWLTLFAGPGFDWTRLVARNSTLDTTLAGETVRTIESRFTVGAKIKPFAAITTPKWLPYLYLSAAYLLMHGSHGAESSFGIRF